MQSWMGKMKIGNGKQTMATSLKRTKRTTNPKPAPKPCKIQAKTDPSLNWQIVIWVQRFSRRQGNKTTIEPGKELDKWGRAWWPFGSPYLKPQQKQRRKGRLNEVEVAFWALSSKLETCKAKQKDKLMMMMMMKMARAKWETSSNHHKRQ